MLQHQSSSFGQFKSNCCALCFRRFIPAFLIFIFLMVDVLCPIPQGFASPIFNQASLALPLISSELGRVEESYEGRSRKTIYFLQDAHDSLEAQVNIAKIINVLVKKRGVKTVFEEGYEGAVPTDRFFGFIKDLKIREKVSYFLLDKLRIGGAEYAHINRLDDFKLVGAENLKLYAANIEYYQKASRNREDIARDLNELITPFLNLANRYFPKNLKTWIKLNERFANNQLPLLNYLRELQVLYQKVGRGLSFPRFEDEYPVLSVLLQVEKAADKNVVEQLNKINSKEVFKEVLRLEQSISAASLPVERDQRIFSYYQGLRLLIKLNQIKLTQPEYEAVKEKLEELDTQQLADFIATLTRRPLVLSKGWERNVKAASRFYEVAQERDQAINEPIRNFLRDEKESSAALVFGGFHAGAIKEILRAHQISYHVISPKINSIDKKHQNYYNELMLSGRHSFEAQLTAEASRAARPPSIFFSAAVDSQDEGVRLNIEAIAELIQSSADRLSPITIENHLASLPEKGHSPDVVAEEITRSELREAEEWEAEIIGWLGSDSAEIRDRAVSEIEKLMEAYPKLLDRPRRILTASRGFFPIFKFIYHQSLLASQKLNKPKIVEYEFDSESDPDIQFKKAGKFEIQLNAKRGKRPPVSPEEQKPVLEVMHQFFKNFSPALNVMAIHLGGYEARIVVNLFPYGPYHFMVVPKDNRPQYLTMHDVDFALTVLEENADLGFLGFNGWGAAASINHLHLPGMERALPLPVENEAIEVLGSWGGVDVGLIPQWPAPAVVFISKNRQSLAVTAMEFVHDLQLKNINHNVLFTREKVFVFPRINEISNLLQARVGIMELSGHIITTNLEWDGDEQLIQAALAEVSLDTGAVKNLATDYLKFARTNNITQSRVALERIASQMKDEYAAIDALDYSDIDTTKPRSEARDTDQWRAEILADLRSSAWSVRGNAVVAMGQLIQSFPAYATEDFLAELVAMFADSDEFPRMLAAQYLHYFIHVNPDAFTENILKIFIDRLSGDGDWLGGNILLSFFPGSMYVPQGLNRLGISPATLSQIRSAFTTRNFELLLNKLDSIQGPSDWDGKQDALRYVRLFLEADSQYATDVYFERVHGWLRDGHPAVKKAARDAIDAFVKISPKYAVEIESDHSGQPGSENTPPRSEARKSAAEYMAELVKDEFTEQLNGKYGKFERIGWDEGVDRLGWVDVVSGLVNRPDLVRQVKYEAELIRERYKQVVFVGMGLRSAETALALGTDHAAPTVHILDTTDLGAVNHLLASIGMGSSDANANRQALEQTLFIGISKGGETVETVKNINYFEQLLGNHQIDPRQHIWVMTDPGTAMAARYGAEGFKVLSIQLDGKKDIGGRFAAPGTRIFLLPAAIRGHDPEALLRQAVSKGRQSFKKEDLFLKLAALIGSQVNANNTANLVVFLPVELRPLWKWIEALFEETLGKNGAGVMVWDGEDIDSHVFNSTDHPAIVLNVEVESSLENAEEKKKRGEMIASLEDRGFASQTISMQSKREILFLLEGLKRTVAALGFLWEVNIVNQPVHQRNKAALSESQNQGGLLSVSEVFDPVLLSEIITMKRDYVELRFYGQPTEDEYRELRELKRVIEKHALVPAKISIAPAADHATLQRMSEGPQNSVVIIFARPEPEVLTGNYEGGANKRFAAQAYQELARANRPRAFVQLNGSPHQSVYQLRDMRRQLGLHLSSHILSTNLVRKMTPIILRLKHQSQLTADVADELGKLQAALVKFEDNLKPATPDDVKLEQLRNALTAVGVHSQVLFHKDVVSPDGRESYREVRYLKFQLANEDWVLSSGSGPLRWADYGVALFPMRFVKHYRDFFWFYESHGILPSILEVPREHRESLLTSAVEAGITHYHIDQTDGQFVKRQTDNLDAALLVKRLLPSAFVETHLMVSEANLNQEIEKFVNAGVQRIYFHVEAVLETETLKKLIRGLHEKGIQAGVTLNPDTDIRVLDPYLALLDAILIMDVVPGGGGRSFIPDVLTKTWELRKKVEESGYYIDLVSDGGIAVHTAKLAALHGADDVITGAFIFGKTESLYDVGRTQAAVDQLNGAMVQTHRQMMKESLQFTQDENGNGYILLLPRAVSVTSRKMRNPQILENEFIRDASGAEYEFLKNLQGNFRRSWKIYDQAMNHNGSFFDVLVVTVKESTVEMNRQRIEALRGIAYPASTPVILVVEPDGLLRDSLSGVINASSQALRGMDKLDLNPKTANVLLIQMAGEASRNRPLSGSAATPGKQWMVSPSGQSLFERTIFESLQFFNPTHPEWTIRAVDQVVGVGLPAEDLLTEKVKGYATFGSFFEVDDFPHRFQAVKAQPDGLIARTKEKPKPEEIFEFVDHQRIGGIFFIRKLSFEAVQGLIEDFQVPANERPLPLYWNYHLNESYQLLDAAFFSEDEQTDLEAWIKAYFDAEEGSLSRKLPFLYPDYLAIRERALNFKRRHGIAFRDIGAKFIFEDTGTNQDYFDLFQKTLNSRALQIIFDVLPDSQGDIVIDSSNINIERQSSLDSHYIIRSHGVAGQSRGGLVMVGVENNSIDVGAGTLLVDLPSQPELIRSPGGRLETFAIVEHTRFRISYPLESNPQTILSSKQFGPDGRYSLEDIWQQVKNRGRNRSESRTEPFLPPMELIVFDMDGTLYSSSELLQAYRDAAYELYRARFGGSFDKAREQVEARRTDLREQGKTYGDRDVLDSFGFTYAEKIDNEKRLIHISEYLSKNILLIEKIKKLRAKYKLVLATNNADEATRQILSVLELTDMFDRVYTQESTGIHKPDKRIFELIQADYGLLPAQMVSVGDRQNADIAPAQGLGMHGILVRGPADLISNLEKRMSEIELQSVLDLFQREPVISQWRQLTQLLSEWDEEQQEMKLYFDGATGQDGVSFSIPARFADALSEPVIIPYISALINNRAMTIGLQSVRVEGLSEHVGQSLRLYLNKHFSQIETISQDYYGRAPEIMPASSVQVPLPADSFETMKIAGTFKHDKGTFIGVNVGQTDIKFVLLENGEFRQDRTFSMPTWTDSKVRTFSGIYTGIVQGVEALLAQSDISFEQVEGIGISVGGIVKEHTMTTRSGIAYGMSDEDFAKLQKLPKILSENMKVPVILDQDVVSKGIALVSRQQLMKTLILDLGTSLGGLYIDKTGAIPLRVNQVGRVSIDFSSLSFDRPDKGGKGVLTQYLSGTGLGNMAGRNELAGTPNKEITQLLKAGDPRAQATLRAMVTNLLASIEVLSQQYDFDTVLLTGGLINSEFGTALLAEAQKDLELEEKPVALVKSSLDPTYEGAIGAADLINWAVQNSLLRSEMRNLPEQHIIFEKMSAHTPPAQQNISVDYTDSHGIGAQEAIDIPGVFFRSHPAQVYDYLATRVASRFSDLWKNLKRKIRSELNEPSEAKPNISETRSALPAVAKVSAPPVLVNSQKKLKLTPTQIMDFVRGRFQAARSQYAMVFVNTDDFPSFSEAQKNEYLLFVLTNKTTSIVFYNEHGQVNDHELETLLNFDRVKRTDLDLSRAVSTFAKPNTPVIHLSKDVLPSDAAVQNLRKRMTFFKEAGHKSGTLATAFVWVLSGEELTSFAGVREENGFWIVDESLLDAIQETYESHLIFSFAA
ncbi:MAG TPA: ROK family protein [Candidatus Omnitrophota bacterium]|nr:ROK family protein [Candidatus Omnitrophota bacterium]